MKKSIQIIALCFCCLWGSVNNAPVQAQMNTDRLMSIGKNALYFDDYVLSIQYFNQVIRLKPYMGDPFLFRAIAKIQLGDYNGALQDCHQCIELSPFLPYAYYIRGYVYRHLQQYAEAEEDFSQALVFAPENHTYMLLRAEVRASQQHYDAAMEDIEYVLRREPNMSSVHFEKGVVAMSAKDTLMALASFEQSVRLDGGNPSNWSALGLTQSMLHQDSAALHSLTQAITLGSNWAGDFINRGILYYRHHRYRNALEDYDEAVRLSPQDPAVYYNRGLLRQELGDLNRAQEDYDLVLELDPNCDEAYYQRGIIALELQQWRSAQSDFDTLIARHPYFLPSYYLAARARTGMHDARGAYQYQYRAQQQERNKDKDAQSANSQVNTDVLYASNQPQEDKRKQLLGTSAKHSIENTEVVNEPIITVSYYASNINKRYYLYAIDSLSRNGQFMAPVTFTQREMPLTAELASFHFSRIDSISVQLDYEEHHALFFARAMEFALVQDYRSAVEDCNRALIECDEQTSPALRAFYYFCRANWRYRWLEYQRIAGEESTAEAVRLEYELLMRDYDQAIRIMPSFTFAYYNKANMLCAQKDYRAAIEHYTMAIRSDANFAEAYFNRGLTYVYTDQYDLGLSDISHAGELGIYQAYSILSRMK